MRVAMPAVGLGGIGVPVAVGPGVNVSVGEGITVSLAVGGRKGVRLGLGVIVTVGLREGIKVPVVVGPLVQEGKGVNEGNRVKVRPGRRVVRLGRVGVAVERAPAWGARFTTIKPAQ